MALRRPFVLSFDRSGVISFHFLCRECRSPQEMRCLGCARHDRLGKSCDWTIGAECRVQLMRLGETLCRDPEACAGTAVR